MKVYKVSLSARIFFGFFSLLIILLGLFFFIYNKEINFLERAISILTIIICICGFLALNKIKIGISDDNIELFNFDVLAILLGKGTAQITLSLNWDEIEELYAHYVLYPESPIIVLKPKLGIPKKRIEFMMFGMPIELLMDILSHLPQETKVSLYTYLKRKLEGKQTWFFTKQEWQEVDVKQIKGKPHVFSKYQLFIIAIFLTLMVIGGFLFSYFIWK